MYSKVTVARNRADGTNCPNSPSQTAKAEVDAYGNNWVDYRRLQLLKELNSVAVSIYLLTFLPFGSVIQSEVPAHDRCYLECLDVKVYSYTGQVSEDKPVPQFKKCYTWL